jgi:hypothetical protein
MIAREELANEVPYPCILISLKNNAPMFSGH